jgi:hypothetical protein
MIERNCAPATATMKSLTALLACTLLAACGGGGGGGGSAASTNASVGGVVSGLPSGLPIVLNNAGSETIEVPANGSFAFAKRIPEGNSYNVTVVGLPNGSQCAVTNGHGVVAHEAGSVSNVTVTCDYVTPVAVTFDFFNVGLTVSGLAPGSSVTLIDNGDPSDAVTATDNGLFVFPVQYAVERVPGPVWNISVKAQPSNQLCTVGSASGTLSPADRGAHFVNIPVSCK